MDRKASVAPFVDGVIPTTMDKKLAPEGTHVFSMFTQWVPDDWGTRSRTVTSSTPYAKRIFDLYNELAPNFKDAIIDYQVIGPYDMEQELGLIGGNIFHGELSVDQLFHMRPAPGYADFRTPIKGLYHGSCADPRRRRGQRHPRLEGVPCGREGQGSQGSGTVGDRTTNGRRSSGCSRRARSRSSAPPSRRGRSGSR